MDFGYNVQKGASAVNYFFANKVKTGAAAFSLFFLCFNGRKKAVRGSAKCEAMSFSIARGGIGRVEAAAAAQQKWVCQSLTSSSSVATQAFI